MYSNLLFWIKAENLFFFFLENALVSRQDRAVEQLVNP